jgi:hypothetical protein
MLLLAGSRSSRLFERLGSPLLSHVIRAHRAWAARFGLIISSSRLARELSQFTLERVTRGVVYPPVDLSIFQPVHSPSNDYALAVGRRIGETHEHLLTEVASRIPLQTVGGLTIQGATNNGFVPSETSLVSLYSRDTPSGHR